MSILTLFNNIYLTLFGICFPLSKCNLWTQWSLSKPHMDKCKESFSRTFQRSERARWRVSFKRCFSVCVFLGVISLVLGHDLCLKCLGRTHAETAFVSGPCPHCENVTIAMLRSWLSFLVKWVTASDPCSSPSAKHKAVAASTQGDLKATTGTFTPGKSPQTSHFSSCMPCPVEFPDEYDIAVEVAKAAHAKLRVVAIYILN